MNKLELTPVDLKKLQLAQSSLNYWCNKEFVDDVQDVHLASDLINGVLNKFTQLNAPAPESPKKSETITQEELQFLINCDKWGVVQESDIFGDGTKTRVQFRYYSADLEESFPLCEDEYKNDLIGMYYRDSDGHLTWERDYKVV